MTAAHTPGPWAWTGEPGESDLAGGDGLVLAFDAYENLWQAAYNSQRDIANARLIASAPDLLEAGKELADAAEQFECAGESRRNNRLLAALEVFRAAIQKATGQ